MPSIEIADVNGKVWVGADGNPLPLVDTIADGQTESRLANLENLVVANADNRFVFGDNWGVDYSFADQFLPTFLRPDDSTLTVDTTPATQNGRALEIDFRNVTNELKFAFESESHTVQTINSDSTSGTFKLNYLESEVVQLDLKGQNSGSFKLRLNDPADGTGATQLTTETISIVDNAKTTAYNIERAIEKAVPSFDRSNGVSVTLVDEALRLYEIRFQEKGRAFNPTLVDHSGGSTVTVRVNATQTTASITQDTDDHVTATHRE